MTPGRGGDRWGRGHPSPRGGAQVREELERRTGHSLAQHKDFIDNEMLLVLAQMDRPSRVFPHLYLVGSGTGRAGRAGRGVPSPHHCHHAGLRVERSQPGGAAAEPVSVGWQEVIWGVTMGWHRVIVGCHGGVMWYHNRVAWSHLGCHGGVGVVTSQGVTVRGTGSS